MIYFIRPIGGGRVKIGCSLMPAQRLQALFFWSPVSLEIAAVMPGGYATEAYFHFKLRAHRLHGEWFEDVPAVRAVVRTIAKAGTYPNAPIIEGRDLPVGDRRWTISNVPSIRERMGLSREKMASLLGTSLQQMGDLESGREACLAGSLAGRGVALAEECGVILGLDDLNNATSEKVAALGGVQPRSLADIQGTMPIRLGPT